MKKSILNKCVNAIHDKNATGYSYVNSLVNVLMEHNFELNINNIITVWHVSFDDNHSKDFYFYSNNQKVKIESLKIKDLCERKTIITSTDHAFSNYRNSNELLTSHIVAIPINHYSDYPGLIPTKGIILLFSNFSHVRITKRQLELLHCLINMREPKVFTSLNVVNAFNKLLSKNNLGVLSYLRCYKYIGDSLDIISNKESSNYHDSGLRHFSLWQYKGHGSRFSLIKEFNRNTYKGVPHKITYTTLEDSSTHFLIDPISRNVNRLHKSMNAEIMQCISYDRAKNSFKEEEYFKELELNEDNCTIIIVASGKGSSCIISCLYIRYIVYSVFISSELIKHYIQEISRRISEENNYTQNLLLTRLMEKSFKNNIERNFYYEASKILKEANEAEDCLIYMFDEKERLELKSEVDSSKNDTYKEETDKIVLPKRIKDNEFRHWIENLDLKKAFSKGYKNFNSNNPSLVNSAMVIQVSLSNQTYAYGYIILINKNHTPYSECVFYNNTFIVDNYKITRYCGLFLIQYMQLQNSVNNRNYLLHKLRHEIPNNTQAIRFSIEDIKDGLNASDIKRNNLRVILDNINLNNSRTYLLAKFFSTVGFTKEQFAEEKTPVNLTHFLNSYIEIFRTEGDFRNVGVYFDIKNESKTINVSNYYQLAIVNVITNAIRYASEGTYVNIEVYNDRLVVTNIGIPIRQNEMDKIYKEGYRSDEAIAINVRGMGYGLYLSKMILEAHYSTIKASCVELFDENYYLQKAFCDHLKSYESTQRELFIHKGLDKFNYAMADKLYEHLTKNYHKVKNNSIFYNYQTDVMQKWLDYLNENNVVFLDMEDNFKKEVYKVSFTIIF